MVFRFIEFLARPLDKVLGVPIMVIVGDNVELSGGGTNDQKK